MYWCFKKNEHTFCHHTGLKTKKNEQTFQKSPLHMYWCFEKNEHTFYHHSGLKIKKNEHDYSLFCKKIKKMEILVFPEKKVVSITENLEISFRAFCCISKFSLFFSETFF